MKYRRKSNFDGNLLIWNSPSSQFSHQCYFTMIFDYLICFFSPIQRQCSLNFSATSLSLPVTLHLHVYMITNMIAVIDLNVVNSISVFHLQLLHLKPGRLKTQCLYAFWLFFAFYSNLLRCSHLDCYNTCLATDFTHTDVQCRALIFF